MTQSRLWRRWQAALLAGAVAACGPAPSIEEPAVESLAGCPDLPETPAPERLIRPVVEGPFASHLNESWREGQELIEVRWLPISEIAGVHQNLVYTDGTGQQFIIAGFPETDFSLLLQLGTIVMFSGPFDAGAGKPFREDLDDDSARKIIAAGDDLSAVWDRMKDIAATIDRLGIDYDLPGPNSNSAAETVVKYAGFPPTEDDIIDDIGSGVDVIAYAKAQGNETCDDPNEKVNREAR